MRPRPTPRRAPATLRASLLALLCACAPGAGQDGPAAGSVLAAPSGFDAQRAWKHLEAQVALGPRPPGSAALETTRKYLLEQLASYGLEPVRQDFTAKTPKGTFELANVYADLPAAPAAGPEAPMIVLGSHFDTKLVEGFTFVGANDGGSSTAALLELARVIAAAPRRAFAYRFLFLDGEEATRWSWIDPDNRYGSKHHVQELLKSGEDRRVKAFVLLDLVGDAHLRLVDDMNSDPDLRRIVREAADRIGLGEVMKGEREPVKDDHLSFIRYQIPSLDLIDLSYGPESRDNRWWHTDQDTLDKCSPDSLGKIGRIVLAALPGLEAHLAQR